MTWSSNRTIATKATGYFRTGIGLFPLAFIKASCVFRGDGALIYGYNAPVQSEGHRERARAKPAHPAPGRLVRALLAWFAANARPLPWRQTRDPYAIWISEIMLQQTQVKTVIPYWKRWMHELPDAAALADAPLDRVLKLWEGLGYYTRARNLQRAAQVIREKHGGQIPQSLAAMLDLPGIGRYTAGAIASIAYNQPAPILDGNVTRVLCRVHGIRDNPREKACGQRLWDLAAELVMAAHKIRHPASNGQSCSQLNQSLMELGATVCTPRQPQCARCPIQHFCAAAKAGVQEQLPNLGRRPAATRRRFLALIIERNGRYLVRQRPDGMVNGRLWEFPNFELHDAKTDPAMMVKSFGLQVGPLRAFATIRHTITRYRMELQACRTDYRRGKLTGGQGRWLTLEELNKLAFSSAHRRLVERLCDEAKP